MTEQVQNLSLSEITPSPLNPRKHYDEAALEDLKQSILAGGVRQPIIVRPAAAGLPVPDYMAGPAVYEIAAGERRWRASWQAGCESIPAFVRDLTDDQLRETQVLDNLHRADLHPMEEAHGYQQLGGTVEEVAKAVGKTVPYIVTRLKLLDLTDLAQRVFGDGHLTLGHALILAKLTAKDQGRALKNLLGANHLPAKTDLGEYYDRRVKERKTSKHEAGRPLIRETEGALREWVEANIMLELKRAPWDLADAALVAEAGPCTTCPKRTGSNPALFVDLTAKEDVCLDAVCYGAKRQAFVTLTVKEGAAKGTPVLRISMKGSHKKLELPLGEKTVVRNGQWVKAKKGSCPSTTRAVTVDDGSKWSDERAVKAGDLLTVCPNQACKVHKHTVDGTASADAGRSAQPDYYQEQQRQRKQDAAAAREKPVREAIWQAAVARLPEIGDSRLALAAYMAKEIQGHTAVTICKVLDLKVPAKPAAGLTQAQTAIRGYLEMATLAQVNAVCLHALMVPELTVNGYWLLNNPKQDRGEMWAAAELMGVDATAILKRTEKAAQDAAKPAKAPAVTPKPAAGKKPAKKLSRQGRKELKARIIAARPKKAKKGAAK